MAETPPLLDRPREVAELLSVSRSRAYELIASGEIESVRIGTSLRVPREALVRYVEKLRGLDLDQSELTGTGSG